MLLICISIMITDVEGFFFLRVFISHLCILFGETSVHILIFYLGFLS